MGCQQGVLFENLAEYGCYEGFVASPSSGKCYCVSTNATFWPYADGECRSRTNSQGHLLETRDNETVVAVRSLIQTGPQNMFLYSRGGAPRLKAGGDKKL